MTDVAATVREVAAFGLPGLTVEPAAAIEPDAWSLTLAQLEHQKLTGIAVAAAEHGWLTLKPEQYEALIDRHREAMAWCLGLERLALDVAQIRHGVRSTTLISSFGRTIGRARSRCWSVTSGRGG
jgi:hypothetical protein